MDTEPQITLRKVQVGDLPGLVEVERGSTPNLSYIPNVFEMFLADETGDFSLAELDGQIVGCAKFTLQPDGSAWLETLRVLPAFQGMGIGKRFYERFFEIAAQKGVKTMRMYTGVENAASKGLAERFGFHLAASYRGAYRPYTPGGVGTGMHGFLPVTSPERAAALIMPFYHKWTGFLVMNRTFYALTPALCAHLARQGMVFEHPGSGSLITLGARFMPEQALHIGLFDGDTDACLVFADAKAAVQGAGRLSCLFPPAAVEIQNRLVQAGFRLEKSDFIVMENHEEG